MNARSCDRTGVCSGLLAELHGASTAPFPEPSDMCILGRVVWRAGQRSARQQPVGGAACGARVAPGGARIPQLRAQALCCPRGRRGSCWSGRGCACGGRQRRLRRRIVAGDMEPVVRAWLSLLRFTINPAHVQGIAWCAGTLLGLRFCMHGSHARTCTALRGCLHGGGTHA